MARWAACLPLLACTLLPRPAAAQATEAWQAPVLTNTRYDEDWSQFADPDKRDEHWTGPFKYIPAGGDDWLSTGIELRLRNEDFRNNLWGSAEAPDDGYLWMRALPYADLHVGAHGPVHARVFVQPIIGYAAGVAPSASPIDQTRLDMLQAFAEIGTGPVTLRAGRQMVSLGTERLIGTRYGPNTPLAFDGLRANIALSDQVRVDLLAVKPVLAGPGSLDDRTSSARSLWGAYAVMPGIDLYYLGYRDDIASFLDAQGRETRHSIGARLHGQRADWHWNVEGVAQFGHFDGQKIRAWTLGTEFGRRLPGLPLSPDATLRFNIVSGDGDAANGTLGTFNALFPKGKYFGELSPIGPTNIVNLNPRVSADLGGGFSASVAAMAYWRYTRADGIYDIPGNLVRGPGDSTARFIGSQAEIAAAWQATPELELSASASLFDPGAFIRQTGPAPTIAMTGFEANFRF